MAVILGVALPFFAVLLCGMLAARLRLLDDAGLMGLNAFVFWFALPALLFHKVPPPRSSGSATGHSMSATRAAACCCTCIVLAVVRWALRPPAAGGRDLAFAASWGNVGYMGVPLLSAAYGEAAAMPSLLAVVLDTWSCRA